MQSEPGPWQPLNMAARSRRSGNKTDHTAGSRGNNLNQVEAIEIGVKSCRAVTQIPFLSQNTFYESDKGL